MLQQSRRKQDSFEMFETGYQLKQSTEELMRVKLMMKLETLIEEHFREQKSRKFYAAVLKTDLFVLEGLSKEILDASINQLLADRQQQETIKMVLDWTLSIKEISYTLGFKSQSGFSAYFKRVTGLSPLAFRRR
ncbi:MAG: helix-turn-helix domain-containing protein [Candidatus Pedobacter colombiensis]|uniref:Helix-turn-helix domain-containing protein n=1 Tax=Candidatus Pedobacter colombiensis TaxID=3121371 RepID=A0AAJ6B6V2_9SPHI|nr:helix-turn-helix domain-containing protein [Pedobacter sp.]WEK20417.1 MAG: helix-turn-helix domain-containing protein [Pedobacter sp.]